MFLCNVCGSTEAKKELVTQIFDVNGKPVLVENIPALVCIRCGDATFGIEVGERIRKMTHGDSKPTKSIELEVFEYS